jgi:hypothetical protein
MLGELAVLDAEEIGCPEAELPVRRRLSEKRPIPGSRPQGTSHHHVALCDGLFDFATIVAEACLDCGDELLPAFVSRRDVRVVLDEVGREIAIDRGGLALLPDLLDELTIEPLVGFGGGSPGRASARQGASKASIAGRMAISVRELPSR